MRGRKNEGEGKGERGRGLDEEGKERKDREEKGQGGDWRRKERRNEVKWRKVDESPKRILGGRGKRKRKEEKDDGKREENGMAESGVEGKEAQGFPLPAPIILPVLILFPSSLGHFFPLVVAVAVFSCKEWLCSLPSFRSFSLRVRTPNFRSLSSFVFTFFFSPLSLSHVSLLALLPHSAEEGKQTL